MRIDWESGASGSAMSGYALALLVIGLGQFAIGFTPFYDVILIHFHNMADIAGVPADITFVFDWGFRLSAVAMVIFGMLWLIVNSMRSGGTLE